MKQEFKFKYTLCENSQVSHTVEFTVSHESTLDELLEQFERFVKACGYVPPTDSVLEFVPLNNE